MTWTDGNTVRRTQAEPARKSSPAQPRQKTVEEIRREKARRASAKRNQQNALAMSPGYVIFLTLAAVVCFAVGIAYVQLQSDITSRISNIAVLESQLEDLQTSNASTEKRIETKMNLDSVREAALALGMKYPDSSQIQYYSVESSDYMNQYGEISSK